MKYWNKKDNMFIVTQGRQSQDANFGDWDSKKCKYLVYDVIYENRISI